MRIFRGGSFPGANFPQTIKDTSFICINHVIHNDDLFWPSDQNRVGGLFGGKGTEAPTPTDTPRPIHNTPAEHFHALYHSLPPCPEGLSERTHIHRELTARRSLGNGRENSLLDSRGSKVDALAGWVLLLQVSLGIPTFILPVFTSVITWW